MKSTKRILSFLLALLLPLSASAEHLTPEYYIHSALRRFDTLGVKIAGGDLQAAFEEAHALKGVLGNLALTPIYNPVSEMTELLRARQNVDYSPYLAEMKKQKTLLDELCGA